MNHSLQMFDFVVSRMAGGQRVEFDRRQVEEAFPHPPRPSLFMMELEICLLLSTPRGKVKPRPEPPTQQEKIDKWAKRHGLRVHRDMKTMNLHVEKLRKRCGCCDVVMEPAKMKGRVKHAAMFEPECLPGEMKACDAVFVTEIVDALRCPKCRKFEPLNP